MAEQERIKAGQHIEQVIGLQPKTLRQQILRGAQLAGLDEFLKRHPLSELRLVSELKDLSGEYFTGDHFRGRIRLSARRVPGQDFGGSFQWGQSQTISSAAHTAEQAMQRTFVYELGHYLLFRLINQLGRDEVERLIEPAYRSARNGGFAVTSRAQENWREYFCEVFSASVYYRSDLIQYDPQGAKMLQAVRRALEVD